MSQNLKQKYTVELNLEVKTAEAQVKKLTTKINNMWADAGNASDRFSVLKNLADYLAAIDEKIASLKNVDLDLFNKIFGVDGVNIDKALKDAIEPITKSPEQIAEALTMVKTQLKDIQDAGNVKGATTNIKKVGETIAQLYKLVGKEPKVDFISKLGGGGRFNEKIGLLESVIGDLEVDWKNTLGKSIGGNMAEAVSDTLDQAKEFVKAKVKEFYDAVLKEVGDAELDKIKQSLLDAVTFNEKDLKKISQAFDKMKTGDYDDLEAGNYINRKVTGLKVDDAAKDAKNDINEQVKVVEYGKKQLVAAWKKYYEAVERAKRDGINVVDGETSNEMEKMRDYIRNMVAAWKPDTKKLDSKGQKIVATDELAELYDYIESGEWNINEIENKINDIFNRNGIELGVSLDEFINMIPGVEAGFERIANEAINATGYIRNMTVSLREMFEILRKPMKTEYKILINGQEMDIRAGEDGAVGRKTMAEAFLSNFDSDTDVDAHSHKGIAANIDSADFHNAMLRQYGGLAKVSAIVGPEFITTLDLAKVKAEDASRVLAKLREQAKNKAKPSATVDEVNQMFKELNPAYEDVAKKWDPAQFGDLAQYIYDVKQSAEQALVPLEKFKNLLVAAGVPKENLSKYKDIFDSFSKDNVVESFNRIMNLEGIQENGSIIQAGELSTSSLDQFTQSIQHQREEMEQLRRDAKFTYQYIRSEMEKYLATNDRSFFEKWFPMQDLEDMYSDFYGDNIDSLTNKIATMFDVDFEEYEDLLDQLKQLDNAAAQIDDKSELEEIIQKRKEIIDLAEKDGWFNENTLETQRAITAEIEKRISAEKTEADKLKEAYRNIEEISKEEKNHFITDYIADDIKKQNDQLRDHLNELVKIEEQEKKNGSLTEAEINRKRELVKLVKDMMIGVRYKDGSYFNTGDFDENKISEWDKIVSKRKKIAFGYENTGYYGAVDDTISGQKERDYLYAGISAFDGDIDLFDDSMIGKLIREYQELHDVMIRCILVGDEVPADVADRLKWFESLDASKLEQIIPKLTELKTKIDAIEENRELTSYKFGADESYYDEKIQTIQKLIALQEEYYALGGINNGDEYYTLDRLKQNESMLQKLKEGVPYVQNLKKELKDLYPDIDFTKSSDYSSIFNDLQMSGSLGYESALEQAKNVFEKTQRQDYDKRLQTIQTVSNALDKQKVSYEELVAAIKAYKDAYEFKEKFTPDGGLGLDLMNELRKKLAFGNITDLIDSDNWSRLIEGKISAEDIAIQLKPHLDASNLKKEKSALVKEFKQYAKQLEDAGKLDLKNDVDFDMWDKVIDDINNGTLTTLDQCIAKFEELRTAAKSADTDTGSDAVTDEETANAEALLQTIRDLKQAVDEKTAAFREEADTVDGVVGQEILALSRLREAIADIEHALDLAFATDRQLNLPEVNTGGATTTTSENPHMVTDPQGRVVTMYRGINGAYGGLVSNRSHGGTFSTDDLELARTYAGVLGKIEKVQLSMKNPLEIEGNGSNWNQIEYIGDNSDEASQKLHELASEIRHCRNELEKLKNAGPTEAEADLIAKGLMIEENTQAYKDRQFYEHKLMIAKDQMNDIYYDSSNPYGKKTTNEIVEIAKSQGYDGVIFKNIVDTASKSYREAANVMVTFEQDQIHYIETLETTFETAISSFRKLFPYFTDSIDVTSSEIRDVFDKMLALNPKANMSANPDVGLDSAPFFGVVDDINNQLYSADVSSADIAKFVAQLNEARDALNLFAQEGIVAEDQIFEIQHAIDRCNDTIKNVGEPILANKYGREQFVNLYKEFYNAVDNAKAIGIDDGMSDQASEIYDSIIQIGRDWFDESWMADYVLGGMKNYIASGRANIDGIEDMVNQVFDEENIRLRIPIELIPSDFIDNLKSFSSDVESNALMQLRDLVNNRNNVVKVESVVADQDEYDKFVNANPIAKAIMQFTGRGLYDKVYFDDAMNGDNVAVSLFVKSINGYLDHMRSELQKVAKVFGMEDVPLKNLLDPSKLHQIESEQQTKQDKINADSTPNLLQNIDQILGQILAVLQGFTGIEADNKNSVKVKEPAANVNVGTSDAYELLASKLPDGIATESTLEAIKGVIEQISSLLKTGNDVKSNIEDLSSVANATDVVADNLKDIVYHAGDLSNISNTLKTLPLGNFKPSKMESTFNGFTGLYTTENFEHLSGNEWEGAPISTIDLSQYKMFNARSDELATNVKEFFNDLNSVIYGYLDAFDYDAFDMTKATNTISIEELYTRFNQVFRDVQMDFNEFKDFIEKAQAVVKGHEFNEIEIPDLDEAASKFGTETSLQGVSKDVFNSDTFQTQLLKKLGFEGIDLRGTKYNSAYTGGTVVFDIKPESVKSVNEKWTDVARREYPESDFWYSPEALEREEKRRQLAFDTAEAYNRQADSAREQAQYESTSEEDVVNAREQLQVEQQITAEQRARAAIDNVPPPTPPSDVKVAVGGNIPPDEHSAAAGGTPPPDDPNEVLLIERLREAVEKVKIAVDAKTEAFREEGRVVDQVVAQEIAALQNLINKLNAVKAAVEAKTVAFKAEGVTVTDTTSKEMTNIEAGESVQNPVPARGELPPRQTLPAPEDIRPVIQQEAQAHRENADAIREEEAAQESANNARKTGFEIIKDYWRDKGIPTDSLADALANSKINSLLNTTFANKPEDRTLSFVDMSHGDPNDINQYTHEYQIFDQVLQQIGYHLSELQPVMMSDGKQFGFSAQIVVNTERVVSNLEEARNILFNIGNDTGIERQVDAQEKLVDAMREETAEQQKQAEQPKRATRKKHTPEEKADRMLQLDALTKYRGELRAIMGKGQTSSVDFNYLNEGLRPEQQEIANLYKNTMLQIEEYIEAVKRGEQIEAGSIQNSIALLREKVRVYKDQNNLTDTGKAKKSNRYDGSNAMSTRTAQHNTIQSKIGENSLFGDSSVLTDAVNKYEEAWSKLQSLYTTLQSMPNPTKDDEANFKAASAECNNLGKEVEKLIKTYEKIHSDPNKVGGTELGSYENRAKELQDYVEATYGAKAQIDGFKNNYNELLFTIDNGNGTFTKAKVAVDNLRTSIIETHGDTEKTASGLGKVFGDITGKFKELWVYTASRFGVDEIIQALRTGIQYVREIDSALTELKKVTNETSATYDTFLQKMSKTASVVGSTVADLTNSAADWGRLGYSLEEAGELAATTAKLLNVSEFASVDEATSALVSSLQAFTEDGQDAGKRAEEIVDILNNIGNKYPVATNELATGLATSGAALVAANNSIEEQVALLAAGNATMQDVSTVAAGLKIVAARLRGTTTDDDDDIESAVTNVSKLQEKIKTLTAEANGGKGIDIINERGEYKSTYEILSEISTVFDKMDDMSQASLLELIAGKNRSSVVAAVLQNGDILNRAYNDAFNSAGSATKELNTYLDSIQGKIDQFTNQLQTFWMNTISSGMVKGVVELGTSLVGLADKIGVLRLALGGLFVYLTAIKKNNPITIFKELSVSMHNYGNAINQIKAIQSINTDTPMDQFNAQNINAYAAAVSNLTAKQQASALASAGLTKAQIQEAMAKNGVESANIEQAMSEAQVVTAKTKSVAITGAQAAALVAEGKIKLSNVSADWLAAQAEEQLTLEKVKSAVASGTLTAQQGAEIISTFSLAGANNVASLSFKGLAASIKLMIASNPVGFILTIGTTLLSLIPIFGSVTDSAEDAAQAAEEVINKYQSTQETLNSQKTAIDELATSYKVLSKGVNLDTNENINLSTSSYQKYLDVCNDIADMYPNLVTGFDAQGNAILSLKGNVDALTESYKEAAQANRQKLIAGRDDIFSTFKNDYDNNAGIFDDTTGLKQQLAIAKEFQEAINSGNKDTMQKVYDNYFGENNFSEDAANMFEAAGLDAAKIAPFEWFKGRVVDEEQFKQASSVLNAFITSTESKIKTAANNVKTLMGAYLEENWDDAKLDDNAKSVVSTIISNLDAEFVNGFESADDLWTWIDTNFIDAFEKNNIGEQISKELSDAFNFKSQLKNGKMPLDEYRTEILSFVDFVKKSGLKEEAQKQILQMFDIDLDKEDSIGAEIDEMLNHVYGIVDESAKDKVLQLSYSDLQIINSDQFKVSDLNRLSWDALLAKIKETRIAMTQDFTTDNFADYAESIGAISENISAYQEALEKLESGTFTLTDFMELIAQFPDLADGVDMSSKSFNGLSKNLRKAIRNSPDDLVDELEDLRDQLVEAEKSTDHIDALINSIENMPESAVKDLGEEYITLADQVDDAKRAVNELKEAMSENPNEGFETRGSAIEQMKTLMEQGAIGSESELWSIAEAFGFTYDSAKTINENADALYKFITAREKWYATDDDGNYTYDGTKKAINAIEKATQSQKFKDKMAEFGLDPSDFEWNYENGKLDFDFDNENWDEIVASLAATGEAAGLTSEEFYDLLMQIGQFFDIDWEDPTDILDYLNQIAEGTIEPTDKLKQYGEAMQEAFGKDSEIDLTNRPHISGSVMQEAGWTEVPEDDVSTVYTGSRSNESGTVAIVTTPILPDGKVLSPEKWQEYTDGILESADPSTYTFEYDDEKYTGDDIFLAKFEGDDAIDKAGEYSDALHIAQEQYDELRDPLKLEATISNKGLKGLNEIADLQGTINTNSEGITVIDTDTFSSVLKEAGYTEDQINTLIAKIKEYENVVAVTNNDPLGLNNTEASLDSVISSLDYFGIEWETTKANIEGNPVSIDINATDLITKLQEKGWTREQIIAYLQTLSSEENGLGITINGQVNMSTDEIDAAIEKANAVPETETTEYTVTGTGQDAAHDIADTWSNVPKTKTTTYNVNTTETTTKRTIFAGSNGGHYPMVNGTAHAQGTGSWGAPETTESLVGELGPELRVRGNEWTLIGQNGAEFTDVRKGDIIFNHKQTEDLLKNGYVTGRGKAYASGTAFASGNSSYKKYTFYDTSNSSSKKSKAAKDATKETADDFKEIFDWIEVRLEEITEAIDLSTAKLDNAIGYAKKNNIIDEIIDLNQMLYDNLTAGASEYYAFAEELLKKVPEQYREMAKDGSIAIESFTGKVGDETLDAINDYREWVQKGADATQQAEETLTEISSLAKQAIDNIAADYENKRSLRDNKIDQYEAYNSLLETDIGYESTKIYQAMMAENNKNIEILSEQRNKMLAELNKRVESGEIKKNSQDWYDAVNDIAAVDTEIIELKTDVEDYQDAINELHWEHFDNFISQLEAVSDEAENLIDILGNEDVVDEVGNWTKEGITSLGLYVQQMENAEMQAKQYREEISYLNKNWKKLGYTEQEYIEKLEELKSGQYDAIKAYEDTKEAIVDLNSERIDAIKEGIEKEIESYEKLIQTKKEELSAEKDLYDFQKSVQESSKDIAEIERKLTAISTDNSSSARAERARLQAELAEAKQNLEDQYYDRSVSNQQEALDKELETFQEEKEAEMESWDEYLKNTEQVVADSLAIVEANTATVYQTLKQMGSEYGLSITEALTSPWKEGEYAIQSFSEKFGITMSATVEELQALAAEWKETMAEIEASGSSAVSTVNSSATNYQASTYTAPTTSGGGSSGGSSSNSGGSSSSSGSGETYPYGKASETTGNIKKGNRGKAVKAIQYALNQLGYGNSGTKKVDGIFGSGTQSAVKKFQKAMGISADGIVGKNTRAKFKLKGYKTGVANVSNDQLAIVDEDQLEELVLGVENGRLTYLSKGSSVIPADLTSNLMSWGTINPQDMLDRNRPSIGVSPSVVNNTMEFHIDASVGELMHVEELNGDNPDEVLKIVNKALEQHTKNLNNALRKFTR